MCCFFSLAARAILHLVKKVYKQDAGSAFVDQYEKLQEEASLDDGQSPSPEAHDI